MEQINRLFILISIFLIAACCKDEEGDGIISSDMNIISRCPNGDHCPDFSNCSDDNECYCPDGSFYFNGGRYHEYPDEWNLDTCMAFNSDLFLELKNTNGPVEYFDHFKYFARDVEHPPKEEEQDEINTFFIGAKKVAKYQTGANFEYYPWPLKVKLDASTPFPFTESGQAEIVWNLQVFDEFKIPIHVGNGDTSIIRVHVRPYVLYGADTAIVQLDFADAENFAEIGGPENPVIRRGYLYYGAIND